VTPLSPGPGDPWSNIGARVVGETTVSIDTGAKANAVLRLVKRVVARHPPEHACPPEWFEAVVEYVCRETDRRIQEGLRSLAKTVPISVFEDVIVQGRGVIHSLPVEVSQGRRGPRPVWGSADQLVGSLERAIKAIEFDGEWKPPKWVRCNRRWDEVKAATVKLVAAYWKDKEKMKLGEVDPSKMGKWLRSFGLPKFTDLRSLLRQRIIRRMAISDAFKVCRNEPYHLALHLLSLTFS
jgi:hypothetical protein